MMATALAMFDKLLAKNDLATWGIAIGVAALVFVISISARRVAKSYYLRLARTEALELAEIPLQVAARTTTLFLFAMSLYAGFSALEASARLAHIVNLLAIIAVFWQSGIWASTATIAFIDAKRRRGAQDLAAVSSLSIIAFVARALIWAIVVLLTLDNLGVNITTLVAGLGIGGVAIALAVQNILGDLLASMSITLDKPFVIGDFLITGEFMGSVEYIGIKSTRLRSLSGEQIVMSNTDLLGSRLRNYGRMNERRVVFTIRVVYETQRALLEQIPTMIRKAILEQPSVRFDRCHLANFGEYSIEFEYVYYVLSPDYNLFMDTQQRINLAIHEAFEKTGVEFAFPTQKLMLSNSAETERAQPTM